MTTRGSASTAMTDLASGYTSGNAVHHSPKRAFRHWPRRFTSQTSFQTKRQTKEKGITKCRLLFRIGVSIAGCCCARP